MKLFFLVPIKATSSLNARMHHMARARRAKLEKNTAYVASRGQWAAGLEYVWKALAGHSATVVITLTRIGPRKMDDDNVATACKACRDGVAKAIGLDDGDERLTWQYAQEKGPYGVRVTIETREAEAA